MLSVHKVELMGRRDRRSLVKINKVDEYWKELAHQGLGKLQRSAKIG